MYKALIVEDDEMARTVLRRLLERQFNFEVFEAENGIHGLSALQKFRPDIIFTDVSMPMMSGIEFLEAVRNDFENKNIPVFVLSAIGEKDVVAKMIQLGISDYLLKPLIKEDAVERISTFLNDHKDTLRNEAQRRAKTGGVLEEYRLLIADKDDQFTSLLTDLMDERFQTFEAATGAEALNIFIEHNPTIVLLGENLGIINEKLVAKKIRELDSKNEVRLLLCSYYNLSNSDLPPEFNGVLHKSLSSEKLLLEFFQKAMGKQSIHELIIEIITNLRKDFVAAVRQTFGVMTTDEITFLKEEQAERIITTSYYQVDLIELKERIKISVIVGGNEKGVESEPRSAKNPQAFTKIVSDNVFGNLVETIAGNLYKTLESFGVRTEQQEVKQTASSVQTNSVSMKLVVPFEMKTGEKLIAALAVSKEGVIVPE